jgi:hypothetical protein
LKRAPLSTLALAVAFLGLAGTAPRARPAASLSHPAVVAQRPKSPNPATPEEPRRTQAPHRTGELECRNCHRGEHQGVVQMYIGIGGRGTPTIPSHMFQVRVECIACHTTPKAAGETGGLSGQTFKPSEQACVNCHGEKYRGMLQQWTTTLAKMTEVVTPKLMATRVALVGADRRNPKHTRAQTLVDDADFNIRYVTLAKGVHNVFYAADLLKLSNGWLDEATALLGKAPAKTDDQLVRGGYCANLCHEAARVKPRETVTFGKVKVPHARHVVEFGATCTSCHSAETHKTVTATAATCASCHHNPQNDRCESCHRAQSAFYRGQTKSPHVKIEPNVMAEAVACTGCHDFAAAQPRAAIAQKCLVCHEAPYAGLVTEWTAGFGADVRKTSDAIKSAEVAIGAARRAGRKTPEVDAALREAREALTLVRSAGVAHNPLAADALLAAARQKADEARANAASR